MQKTFFGVSGAGKPRKKTKTSPTKRALDYCRDKLLMSAYVVERWNAHADLRQDMFGFVDIVAYGEAGHFALQVTSVEGVTNRVKKIIGKERLREHGRNMLLGGAQIFVWGMADRSGAPEKVVKITMEMLCEPPPLKASPENAELPF